MKNINALIMDGKDNVATCTTDICPGADLYYCIDNRLCMLPVLEKIPYCHKVSIAVIKKGEYVIKYGEVIGVAVKDIPAGSWVSHENIESLPRDYENEFIHIGEKN